jgi:Beta-galactosidase
MMQAGVLRLVHWHAFSVLLLVMAACSGGGGSNDSPAAPAPSTPAAQTSKVFALMDVGDSAQVLDSFAIRSTVDGLAFRTAWGALEPQDGIYDWTTLDAALDTVRARGKQLTLHVGASSIGLPRWLAALGAASYTYSTPMSGAITDPVPWDSTYLSRYTRFVAALAAHIQARGDAGLLYAVSDGVPVAEMSIVGCQNGVLSGGMPYSRANYLTAWNTTVDAHATAFPNAQLLISAPISGICVPDNDGKAFYTEVMNHALVKSAKATIFAADLNATGSSRMAQADASISARAALNFQMIWSSTNDTQNRMHGPLKDAVCRGIGYGARYFEIYKADISSADVGIADAIQRARAGQPC